MAGTQPVSGTAVDQRSGILCSAGWLRPVGASGIALGIHDFARFTGRRSFRLPLHFANLIKRRLRLCSLGRLLVRAGSWVARLCHTLPVAGANGQPAPTSPASFPGRGLSLLILSI